MSCPQQKHFRVGLDGRILRLFLRHQTQWLISSVNCPTQKSPVIEDGTRKQTRPLHKVKQSDQSGGQLRTLTGHQRDHELEPPQEEKNWQRKGDTKPNKTIKFEKGKQILRQGRMKRENTQKIRNIFMSLFYSTIFVRNGFIN